MNARLRLSALGIFCLAMLSAVSASAENNTVYEIFVRSFSSSDPQKKIGDLKGLTQKLDYLNDGDVPSGKSLKVGILWLMPVFPSTSYHGYDVTNYNDVNPDYGKIDDLKALLTKAHARGLRIILDIPFNHVSNRHPWFVDALQHPDGPHKGYFLMFPADGGNDPAWHTTTDGNGNRVKYFGLFGESMPDLNYDSPDVRKEVKAVAKFWLDLGVDGFRLDAAKHIYGWSFNLTEADILKNNDWWREFSTFVHQINLNAVLVGEVLGDSNLLVRHAWGLDALIDEPFMNGARAQIEHPGTGFVGRWKQFIDDARAVNPAHHFDSFVYLSSHDRNPRLASELEHTSPGAVEAQYRLGLCLLMATGKYPILYQGDELMQRGWKWNGNRPTDNPPGDGSGVFDETLREPLPWHATLRGDDEAAWQPPGHSGFLPKFERPNDGVSVETEGTNPHSVLALTRMLTGFRKQHDGFANADVGRVLSDTAEWMVYERVHAQERFLVLINPTAHGKDYGFNDRWYPEFKQAKVLLWSDGLGAVFADESDQNNRISGTVFVPPYGMVILQP